LRPAQPDSVLGELSVPVGVGTDEQIEKLEEMLSNGGGDRPPGPVLVIGGGKVGRAAARALKRTGAPVHIVDRSETLREKLEAIAERVTIGDAADIKTITRAGINESSLVILSTNDDAVNIYLAVYCRRLNPDVRIVSRVTHERNREAMHRAGADFVLSYANLGAETILSLILGRDPVLIGGGVEFLTVRMPGSLAGLTLSDSGIGALTGLIVLAVETDGKKVTNPPPSTILPAGAKLTLLGTAEQWSKFNARFD
jgi:Trk K+ transport system NAD-binding subunit